jgi:uncharacterized membrane protein (DUF2068 family)
MGRYRAIITSRAALRLIEALATYMNSDALFRFAVIGSLAFGLLAVGVDFLPDMVPENVVSAVGATLEPEQLSFVAIASLVVGVAGLVATLGLVLFSSWSRPLALVSTIASLTLYPLASAMVQSGFASMLFYMSAFSWGIAISMAYFSPLSDRFAGGS